MARSIWRKMAAAALLIAIEPSAHAANLMKNTLKFDGHTRTYYLYVPGSVAAKPAPLLVLLHGSYSNGERIIRLWTAEADAEGIILLAPDARKISGWTPADDGPSFLRATMEAAAAQAPVDPQRLYLFGQSGGAVYALLISMLESRYFAATAVHAGAWRKPLEFRVMHYAKRKIPMEIFIGNLDRFFQMRDVRHTEAKLKAAGFPITVTVLDGGLHWYTPKVAKQMNADAWRFLSAHRLDGAPVFERYQ